MSLDYGDRPRKLLSRRKQKKFIELMQFGTPPLLLFQKLHVSYEDVIETLTFVPPFEQRVRACERILSSNVSAAMYKAAMSGSVYAQANYLRLCRLAEPGTKQPKPALSSLTPIELHERLIRCLSPYVPPDMSSPTSEEEAIEQYNDLVQQSCEELRATLAHGPTRYDEEDEESDEEWVAQVDEQEPPAG